ncbi:MAG: hypothetical protein FWB91_03455 [Defluviitaleaceae bacterium]|nr:hypothetical protein [Defluviitaleaceae bacterium]
MKKRTRKLSKVIIMLFALALLSVGGAAAMRVLAQPTVVTISEARSRVGTWASVTVEGYITGSQAANVAFMQASDASGPNDGIMVQITNAGSFTGQRVRVTGYVMRESAGHFIRINGARDTNASDVTLTVLNSEIAQIDPIPITLEQARRGFEGMLVSVSHPVQISTRTAGTGTPAAQNHFLMGTGTVLRAELYNPSSASISTIQNGCWVYIRRGHVLNFRGENQIYSSRFNGPAYAAMTGISNAERITVTDISSIPVSRVRASATGTWVTIEGHITGSQAANVAFMQAINASGPNDGIMVQIANAGSFTGQHVRVTGYVQTMQGHIRINGARNQTPTDVNLTVINSATATRIDPIPITLEQARTGFQGMLVSLIDPVEIEAIAGPGAQQHPLVGTGSMLRMNFDTPSGAFSDVQGGSLIYVNRAHIFYFTGGQHRIYSSSFNESATIAITGINNAGRITVR